jgi:transcriptional antiterminator NusG
MAGKMTEEKEKIVEGKSGQWFVIHTMSGQENRVRDAIEKSLVAGDSKGVYKVLVPVEKISDVKQGKKTTTVRKCFPGYVLVNMDLYRNDGKLNEETWYFVRQIKGVLGFVGSDNRPIPLRAEEEQDMMRQMRESEEKVVPKIDFEVGEVVKIRDGAFENFEGNIEEIDHERGKLKILVSIFGRSTPVELEYWQVERE